MKNIMDTTLFLAQLWGPVLLAIGIGVFTSRRSYADIYRNTDREPFGSLIFGIAAMALGILQVSAHNVWSTLPEGLVSLLGWALLIKGVAFIVAPYLADKGGEWFMSTKLISAAGGVLIILGVYLSWIGYLI